MNPVLPPHASMTAAELTSLLAALLLFAAIFLLAAAFASILLERISRRRRLVSLAEIARRANPTLIVALGCPPRTRRGRPSRYLIGRASAAAAAFHYLREDLRKDLREDRREDPGEGPREELREVPILCSGRITAPRLGENGGPDGADEAEALAVLLEAARVPRASILFDRSAARTIDTVDHLAEHHHSARILIVTQAFHLPRALFLARARGLEAWGLAAPGPTPGWRGQLREGLGRMRAVWDVGIRWRRR